MKLYLAPGSCSLAVHIALRHIGLSPDIVRMDLATGKTEDGTPMDTISPKGYVPALFDDEGELLTEVVATMIELDARYPEAGLLPKSGKDRRIAIEWLAYISAELQRNFVLPLFLDVPQTDDVKAARAKVEKRLAFAAGNLSPKGPFFLGEQPTAVDFYLMVMMFWTGPSKVDLSQWPDMVAYRDRLLQVPAVGAAMKAEGLM